MKPENKEKLKAILCYHVVAGRLRAAEVVAIDSVKTLNGKSVNVSVQGGQVRVNQAKVTQADISCENGVIHVIDAVISPE